MATLRCISVFGKTKQAISSVLKHTKPRNCAFHDAELIQSQSQNSNSCTRPGIYSKLFSRKSLQRLRSASPPLFVLQNGQTLFGFKQASIRILSAPGSRSLHATRHLQAEKGSGSESTSAERESDVTGSESGADAAGSESDAAVSGSESDSDVSGSESDSDVSGSESDSDFSGSESDSDVTGSESDSDVTGSESESAGTSDESESDDTSDESESDGTDEESDAEDARK